MIPYQIKVTFPAEFRTYGVYAEPRKYNKVEVIKAVRMLTGCSLKVCKEMTELPQDTVKLAVYTGILQSTYDEVMKIFRNNGVTVEEVDENNFHTSLMIALEKLCMDAIRRKEYGMGIRILEFMNTLK